MTAAVTAVVLAAAMVFGGTALASSTGMPAGQTIDIRLATLALRGTSPHLALEQLAQEWRRISGGRVRLIVYPDYHQGEAAMVDKMGVRGLDAAVMTNAGLSKIDNGVTCLDRLPMGFRSFDEVDYVQEKLRNEVEARLLKKGFVPLFLADIGWVHFFSRKPVVYPDDLRKQKLFVWAGDTSQADIMKEASFDPVSLETSDILTGLSSGLIDAVPTTPSYANGAQFYTAAKHMLELNWAPLVGGAVIRKDAWERVPAELRQELLRSAEKTGRQIKAMSRKESADAVRAMEGKHGLQVHRVTPEAELVWRAAAESVYPRIRGRLIPTDLFDKLQGLLREYRSRAPGNGK
jgi:TRAP-type C4-dicarboxylate transport system substrate-binding protein